MTAPAGGTTEDDLTGFKLDVDGVIVKAVVMKGVDVIVGSTVAVPVEGRDGVNVARGAKKEVHCMRKGSLIKQIAMARN